MTIIIIIVIRNFYCVISQWFNGALQGSITVQVSIIWDKSLKYLYWFFLQSNVVLFVNRLDSVESVIPYEYSRFVFKLQLGEFFIKAGFLLVTES